MAHPYTQFTDFLKDKTFIQWQLMPDEALDSYWYTLMENNPGYHALIDEAARSLKTLMQPKTSLTADEMEQLLARIENSIRQKKRRKLKMRRLFRYVTATCAGIALLIGLSYYILLMGDKYEPDTMLMLGEMMESEQIQLVTGGRTMTFQNNIEVEVDATGQITIAQEDEEEKTIESARYVRNNILIVPYGRRTQLTLPDGSRVWLNSGSMLEFPGRFVGNSREIRLLSGEMFIDVARNDQKRFYVHTSDFQIQVYGTAFNVSVYDDSSQSVVLVSGSVVLRPDGGHEQALLPGTQALLREDGTFGIEAVDVCQHISWTRGYLLFERTPMPEVLRQIARFYNLSFDDNILTGLHNRTCTGRIMLFDNLCDVMATVSLLSSTYFRVENNRIYVTNYKSN